MPSDTTRVLLRFVETLERLSIPYAVGGSSASGAHGEPRATRVVDVLITLSREQIDTGATGARFEAGVRHLSRGDRAP